MQQVDALVAAREPAGAAQIRVHDDTGHVVGTERPGMSLDPHVAEAVRGEARLEVVAGDPAGHDLVDLPERQRLRDDREVDVEVRSGEVAGRVEVLSVAQHDPRALGTEVGEPDPAVDVLSQVHDPRVAERGDRHRAQRLDPAHGWRDRAHDRNGHVALDRGEPPAVVEVRGVHPRVGEAEVVALAADEIGRHHMRRRREP